MKRSRDLAMALSLASICFLEPWARILVLPGGFEGRPPTRIDYAGIMVAILASAVVLFGAARLVRRLGGIWLGAARLLVVMTFFIPAYAIVRAAYESCGLSCVEAFFREHLVAFTIGSVVLIPAAITFRSICWRIIRSLILFSSPFVILTFGQAIAGFAHAPWSPVPPLLAPPPMPGANPSARVVWIIFDELDDRTLFRERPSSLNAPEFDHLRASALRAAEAYPPGPETMISIPGMMAGRLFKSVEFDFQGLDPQKLRFEEPGAGTFSWTELTTVFSRARAAGHDVRALGWMFPYCRLMSSQLGACVDRPAYFGIYSHDPAPTLARSVMANLVALLPWNQRRLHLRDFTDLLDATKEIVGDAKPGLLYIHLPVPHAPPIFNRSTGQATVFNFAEVEGYLDNLALADRTLGDIRRTMEATGAWDRSTVIVSSDHFWRDSPRLQGRGDHHIPFLLKPAGSRAAFEYQNPFNTVLTGDLVLAILHGDIANVQAAAAWIDAQRSVADYPYYDTGQH